MIYYLFCIGEWTDVEKYCANSKEHSVIDGKIYDMPHITFYLSDGSERTMFFKSNQEMRKMERQIIIKKINNKYENNGKVDNNKR